ncbi:MAG: RNA-binding S4 domain-containing protein [Caulobacterales bacterium]
MWLWRARFFKTRTLASAHVSAGGVRIARAGNVRRVDKPGEGVSVGDELSFATPRGLVLVRVEALGVRRGPAAEARGLYALLDGAGLDSHVSGSGEEEVE